MINSKILKRRIKFWFTVAIVYLSKNLLRNLFVLATFCVVFFLFIKIIPNFKMQKVYTEGIIGNYEENNLPIRVLSLLSEGLTKVDDNDLIQPALSKSWQIKDSGRTYLFSLDDNLFWQDKTKVKSNDIAIKIENVDISYPNEKTLQFKLKDQYSPFLSIVSKPIFKKDTLIGTGKYRVDQIEKAGQIVKTIKLTTDDNKYPKIIFRFYPIFSQAVSAFKMGDIKAISNLTQTNSLSEWPNTEVVKKIDYSHMVVLFFNTKSPLFSNKEIRQAFAYALDKSAFKGELASSPISPNSWAYNSEVKTYNYNIDKAKSLLDKNQIKKEEKIILSVLPSYKDVGEKLISDWKKLGLNIELKIENSRPNDFQIFLAGQEIPADPDQYSLWHSTQIGNLTKFQNPKIDKLLEDGRRIEDQKVRKEKYFEFQKVIADELPAIFLYYPENYFVFSKKTESEIKKLKEIYPSFAP